MPRPKFPDPLKVKLLVFRSMSVACISGPPSLNEVLPTTFIPFDPVRATLPICPFTLVTAEPAANIAAQLPPVEYGSCFKMYVVEEPVSIQISPFIAVLSLVHPAKLDFIKVDPITEAGSCDNGTFAAGSRLAIPFACPERRLMRASEILFRFILSHVGVTAEP